jgi:hypothetical protein
MTKYRSIKEVYAEPMDRLEAEKLNLVRDVTGEPESGYRVQYSDDYESWSPKYVFEQGYIEVSESRLLPKVKTELQRNNNKISPTFIESLLKDSESKCIQLTPTTRVCTITLASGHEVVGVAQVLDSKNDVASIGNSVAFSNAKEQLWQQVGAIAKDLL